MHRGWRSDRRRHRTRLSRAERLPPQLAAFLRDELGDADDGSASSAWTLTTPLWIWTPTGKDGTPAKGAWYFLTIDGEPADAIRNGAGARRDAWGSVRVTATIGATTFQTSVFPSKQVGGYMLPVKGTVRKAEKLSEGDSVTVTLSV